MKTPVSILLSFFISFIGFAQKGHVEHQSHFENTYQSISLNKPIQNEQDITTVVKDVLNINEHELELTQSKNSKTALYNTYQLKLNNYSIFGSFIKATVRNKKITHISYPNSIYITTINQGDFPLRPCPEVNKKYSNYTITSTSSIYFPKSDQLVPALLVELNDNHTNYLQLICDAESILHVENTVKFFRGPNDTMATAMVFNPDPLTTANRTYAAPYHDNNDADIAELNNERVAVNLLVSYLNNKFVLENDFVAIRDHSNPTIAIAESSTPSFNFTRSQSGFEDVMVLYHITNFKEHINGLGYTSLPGYRVEADPHALSGADQSAFYQNFNPPRILFGEGGVDDAEDADVIIHEYIHAVVNGAIGVSPGNTTERNTIEEALADYFAGSYSRAINSFNFEKIFSWDGHNEFWDGREGSSQKNYQLINFGGDIYEHTDILVSCLLHIDQLLGRNVADEMILEAIYNLSPGTTMPQFAWDVVRADSVLNGGQNFFQVYNAFVARNILPVWISLPENKLSSNTLELRGSYNFARGYELTIYSPDETVSAVELFSLSGKAMPLFTSNNNEAETVVRSASLKPGMYLLKVITEKGRVKSFKIARY